MARNEVTYDLIERYLNKQLTSAEQQNFLARMREDKEFAEEVFLLKEIPKLAYQEDRSSLDLMDKLGEKYFDTASRRIFPWMKLAAAAAFIGVICLSVFILPDLLQKDSLAVAELDFTEMSAGASSLAEGEKYYEEGNYDQALAIFNDHLREKPEHIEVMEAAGLCYLNLGQSERASSTFQQVLNSDAIFRYKDNARWYLALNAFMAKDHNICKKYLQEVIADPKSRNKDKAKKLLTRF